MFWMTSTAKELSLILISVAIAPGYLKTVEIRSMSSFTVEVRYPRLFDSQNGNLFASISLEFP